MRIILEARKHLTPTSTKLTIIWRRIIENSKWIFFLSKTFNRRWFKMYMVEVNASTQKDVNATTFNNKTHFSKMIFFSFCMTVLMWSIRAIYVMKSPIIYKKIMNLIVKKNMYHYHFERLWVFVKTEFGKSSQNTK